MKRLLALSALFAITATPALADRIDGNWCGPSGERMAIDGSDVTTPGGAKVEARYSRHSIEYDVPEDERPREGRIRADQIDDDTIRVSLIRKVQKEPPAHDTWIRCEDYS